MILRRSFLIGLLAGATCLSPALSLAGPRTKAPRRVRRKVRRLIRRRIRRRAVWRARHGWRVLAIPVALAVGWELLIDDRVVVVRELKTVDKNDDLGKAVRVEVVVVDGGGKSEEIVVQREDSPENAQELDGTVLGEGEKDGPSVEKEEEVEEEVEE